MTDRKNSERADEEAREDVVAEQNDDFDGAVRNPLWQSDTVDTRNGSNRVEDVSPIFAQGKIDAFSSAKAAVDENPEHPEGVVLPEENDKRTNEEAIASLDDAKAEAKDDLDAVVNPDHETTDDSKIADAKSQADKADMAKKASGGGK